MKQHSTGEFRVDIDAMKRKEKENRMKIWKHRAWSIFREFPASSFLLLNSIVIAVVVIAASEFKIWEVIFVWWLLISFFIFFCLAGPHVYGHPLDKLKDIWNIKE